MALRICKGNYEIINIKNKKDLKTIDSCTDKYKVLYYWNHYLGFICQGNNINYDYLTKDNWLMEGHKVLNTTNLEYIPIISNDTIIGFCYDDDFLNDALNKINDLISFANRETILKKYNNAIIYGYNELAYYLEILFNKYNIPYIIKDELYKKESQIKVTNKTMKIYVEGNIGESINNYSFWKVFHEWLYESVKPIYDLYDYCNKYEHSSEDNICDYIKSNKPFMMARIGNTELWIIKQYIQQQTGLIDNYSEFWLKYLFETSGFFAKDNNINAVSEFARQHIEAVKNCDFNLCYGKEELAEGLAMVLNKIQANPRLNYDWNLLTNPFQNKWFKFLENKKILIISPYSKSIEIQKNKLNHLYDYKYPKMEIKTYQCLETQLSNNQGYDSFFESLAKMEQDISKIDFDIAFIGAGAYGYLLASYIKNIGKSSIELCSYLPNWWGIKIKRYCTCLNVNRYWNKNWIFPIEKPLKGAEKIEDSCYWE